MEEVSDIDYQELYEQLQDLHAGLAKHRTREHQRQSELIGELLDAVVGPRKGALHGNERDQDAGLINKVEANSEVLAELRGHMRNGGVPSKVRLSGGQWTAIIGAMVTGAGGITVAIVNLIADLATH